MARINARAFSRYASETPAPSETADQENRDPRATTRMDKGKGRASDLPLHMNLPTPASDDSNHSRGHKRKRAQAGDRSTGDASASEDEEEEADDEQREAAKFVKYFDPNQNPDQRREIKRKSRALEREFQDSRDDLLRDSGQGLARTIDKANNIYRSVKQTNDATLDSRLLVHVSDLAYKKTAQLVIGDNAIGVDVDEFLSKCITYMQNGGPINRSEGDEDGRPSTSRRGARRTSRDSDDEDDDETSASALDWAVLGRYACFPHNSRPCVPSFLLGPLSVEKKQRTHTQRRARQSKDTAGREARPETLSRENLSHSDENGLTAICKRINQRLNKHIGRAESTLQRQGFTSLEELRTQRGKNMLKELRVSDTGGPSLFDFVVNPHSFGQTVENLFYVSFLIKEGAVGIQPDSSGLPTIIQSEPGTLEEQRQKKTSKHQAIFSLDYATWQSLIEAFEIKEPLIPHRHDEDGLAEQVANGQRGWYT